MTPPDTSPHDSDGGGRPRLAIAAVALLALALTGGAVAPAVAQSGSDSGCGAGSEFLGTCEQSATDSTDSADAGMLDQAMASLDSFTSGFGRASNVADGALARASLVVQDVGNDETPTESAENVVQTYNQSRDQWVACANQHVSFRANQSYALRATFVGEDTRTSRILEIDTDANGTVTRMEWVRPRQSKRVAGEWIELEDLARKQADEELAAFQDEYLPGCEQPDTKYIEQLAGAYGTDVDRSEGLNP